MTTIGGAVVERCKSTGVAGFHEISGLTAIL
jgi:hypothetical protein